MWHLTIHRWRDGARPTPALLDEHLAWMRAQQEAGRILAAGPTPDHSMGIMLFGHLTEQQVHDVCETDPFVAAGKRTYEVIPWEVHHAFGIGGFDRRAVSAMFGIPDTST